MPEIAILSRDEVSALLPPLGEQIKLAESTYAALAAGRIEAPPKPGIHPRPNAFIHAMPAYITGDDIAGMKWVSGYPENPARGLPYISGVIVLSNPETGEPVALLDGAEITAARTAAASGVCIEHFAPQGWQTVGLLGCGEQGRYHVKVIRTLAPEAQIRAWDPDPTRPQTVGEVDPVGDARTAVAGADVVITAGPILEDPEPQVVLEWLQDRYLLLPIDFDANIARGPIENAGLFAVDDVGQFDYYRAAGHFRDWPVPQESVGEAIARGERSDTVACVNLGIGALDVAFAAVVVTRAREENVGCRVTI
jgi:ornithine cyclodeaminase/alanine dehydrogenase